MSETHEKLSKMSDNQISKEYFRLATGNERGVAQRSIELFKISGVKIRNEYLSVIIIKYIQELYRERYFNMKSKWLSETMVIETVLALSAFKYDEIWRDVIQESRKIDHKKLIHRTVYDMFKKYIFELSEVIKSPEIEELELEHIYHVKAIKTAGGAYYEWLQHDAR